MSHDSLTTLKGYNSVAKIENFESRRQTADLVETYRLASTLVASTWSLGSYYLRIICPNQIVELSLSATVCVKKYRGHRVILHRILETENLLK